MDNAAKLARLFKERENPYLFSPQVGKVVNPLPDLRISIMSGDIILYSEQLYVNTMLTDEYQREFETEEGKLTFSKETESSLAGVTGQATEPVTGHKHGVSLSDTTATLKGKIDLKDTLKKDDLVKVTPTADGQTWFVDYMVKKAGE